VRGISIVLETIEHSTFAIFALKMNRAKAPEAPQLPPSITLRWKIFSPKEAPIIADPGFAVAVIA
jgi:hypothetical protein